MTIEELIERLEEARDELGGDCEVRLMTQQNWPFENSIEGICSSNDIELEEDDEDDEDAESDKVLFIVEGSQLGYGSKKAWDVCH